MVYIFSTSTPQQEFRSFSPPLFPAAAAICHGNMDAYLRDGNYRLCSLVPQGLRPILHSAKRKRAEILLYLSSFPFLSFFSLLEAGIPQQARFPENEISPIRSRTPARGGPSQAASLLFYGINGAGNPRGWGSPSLFSEALSMGIQPRPLLGHGEFDDACYDALTGGSSPRISRARL